MIFKFQVPIRRLDPPVNRRLELLYGREQKKQNLMLENYSTGAKKYIETYFSQL